MANVSRKAMQVFPLVLAALLVLASLAGLATQQSTTTVLKNPQTFNPTEMAVTIKTQEAADSIKGGIKGIDVSEWQGDINWKRVANDDINFAIIRASYGMQSDKTFLENAREAGNNGILVGAYHYAKFKSKAEAIEEADFFISHLKQAKITYPVVLDLESYKGVSKSNLTKYALVFMERVKAAGYTVMFYSYENFFDTHVNSRDLQDYPFWIANYITQPTKLDHQIWQHTSYGSVDGITGRVDINIAYSDLRLRKTLKVNKTVSDEIKSMLNKTYNAQLSMDKLVVADVRQSLAQALQQELNKNFKAGLTIDGNITSLDAQYFDGADLSAEMHANLIQLAQAALFYRGHYEGSVTGKMDSKTKAAIASYQKAQQLEESGVLCSQTVQALFQV